MFMCNNLALLVTFSQKHIQTAGLRRSSRLQMFYKKGVLKNFSSFTEKHLFWSLFWIKLSPAALLKRDSNTGVFLWILQHFKNSLFYRTLSVAASLYIHMWGSSWLFERYVARSKVRHWKAITDAAHAASRQWAA